MRFMHLWDSIQHFRKTLLLNLHFSPIFFLPSLSAMSRTFMLDHWCYLTVFWYSVLFFFLFFLKKIKSHAFVRNNTNRSCTIPPVITSCRTTVKYHNQDNNINRVLWPYSDFLGFARWAGNLYSKQWKTYSFFLIMICFQAIKCISLVLRLIRLAIA